ncbi:MAG TPA: hypothetical protein VFR13_05495 [Jiangellaceae bacterium]|nr:hypothetical protein [Jiangellaceae bacterium]
MRFHAIARLDGGKLDGIHLLWSPPWPTGHSLDGFTIYRREARGEKDQFCLTLTTAQLAETRQLGRLWLADAVVWAQAKDPDDPQALWTYRIELIRRHSVVTVTSPEARAAFVGTPDGTVVAGAVFAGPTVTLRGSDLGIVWLVSGFSRASAEVCGDVPDEDQWDVRSPIVSNLQVPFGSVNAAVPTAADGRTLADKRATPERITGDFPDVTRYADAALRRPGGVPAMRVMANRLADAGEGWDVSPYGLAVAPTMFAPWRRGWGLSHLDQDSLVPRSRYDYRIVGTVPRSDRDESVFDLHTVPRGYRLPRSFRWGTAVVWTDQPTVVVPVDTTGGSPSTFRKGIELKHLQLALDTPSRRVLVELQPRGQVSAKGFRHGTGVGAVSTSSGRRTLLDFGTPVDFVTVDGDLAVSAIVPRPLDPALRPDDPVPINQTVYDVEYGPTPPPDPPSLVQATNLSDPARAAARGMPDTGRGFEVVWTAPPSMDPAAQAVFPPSASAAPTEVAYYLLDRTWAGGPFTPADGDGVQLSGRNAATGTDTPSWGMDLLAVFPPADAAPSSFSALVHATETFEPAVLSYGEAVTYRVQSVDAIGRPSNPTLAAPVPLRSYVRPPAPTTPPPIAPVDPSAVPRTGVQAMLLQHDDPDLTAAQAATAAGTDVVALRWGWGPEQRELAPDVAEFRVYRHGSALTAIDLVAAGTPTASTGGWTLPVTASRAVATDEFAGLSIVLGLAYRVLGHPAGTTIALRLAPSPVDPGRAPVPGPLTINRTTLAELDPEYWDKRVAVVPRAALSGTDVESYELVLPAAVTTTDTTPRQRLAFGVTAADTQSYVPDRRIALELTPRAGNESTVAAREVTARYYGRPSLVPVNLADVPALTLRRQAGDSVHGVLRPADHVPAGGTVVSRMLLERISASAVLTRLRVEPGSISLVQADESTAVWPLSPADDAALRAGYAAHEVPDRFLAHAATRLDTLDESAERVGTVDPTKPVEDTLPNRPSRWLYRLRIVDAAGRPSAAAQLLGVVVHVPSPSRAVAPVLRSLDVNAGTATVRLDCTDVEGDPYVFLTADDSLGTATASLATIRNRPDLAPIDRLVVRDAGGGAVTAVAAVRGADDEATASVAVPADGLVLHAWALSVTSDGVPSRLVGPLHAAARAV